MWGGGMPDDITIVALRVINKAQSSAAVRLRCVCVCVFVSHPCDHGRIPAGSAKERHLSSWVKF